MVLVLVVVLEVMTVLVDVVVMVLEVVIVVETCGTTVDVEVCVDVTVAVVGGFETVEVLVVPEIMIISSTRCGWIWATPERQLGQRKRRSQKRW